MTSHVAATSAHQLYADALELVYREGRVIEPDRSESNQGEHEYLEVDHVMLELADSRDRLVTSRDFSFARAALRFLWIIAGCEDAEPLESLFPRVTRFADDGIHLTGSAVGARLQSNDGCTSQLDGVLRRLRDNPTTRRATAVAWLPKDASRRSVDIPCLLTLSWHIRDGKLLGTSVMRANNVVRLLPYNLFEYTMLTECLASELGIEVGSHHHHVISLHAYKPDIQRLGDLGGYVRTASPPLPMAPMPMDDRPLDQARKAWQIVSEIIIAIRRSDASNAKRMINTASELNPYWLALVRAIGTEVASVARDTSLARWIDEVHQELVESSSQA